jgi:cytochrome P450
MTHGTTLPRYQFRIDPPSLWDVMRQGVSDSASTIPASILTEPGVQLAGQQFGAPLMVSDPDLAREILNDRDVNFTRYKTMRRLLRRAWGQGLAAAEGEAWTRQRKAATPAFTPSAVAGRSTAFAEATGKTVGDWPIGQPVELTRQVAQIIAEIVFTTLVDGKGVVDTKAVAADMPAYIRRIASFGSRDLLPLPETWHDWLNGIAKDPAVQHLRAVARMLAANRSGGQDMIALLEGVGPLQDNILGLMPAAMDTTVAGTSWALYTLARCPDWQTEVAEEARACAGVFTLDRLPITRRVVQEVLRLYPPAPLVVRAASRAMDFAGFRLKRGQTVAVSIYAMHRHRAHWDAPDSFDPDRFLPERTGKTAAWMPFGVGPRMCIAAQFALAEICIVVARLLADLELAPTGPEPQVTLQVTTRSATGLNVVAQQRG